VRPASAGRARPSGVSRTPGIDQRKGGCDAPRKWGERSLIHVAALSGAQSCGPPRRYFEAKNRSRISAYQWPAMSSPLPAIENLISSIVEIPVLDLRWRTPELGASRLNFKGQSPCASAGSTPGEPIAGHLHPWAHQLSDPFSSRGIQLQNSCLRLLSVSRRSRRPGRR
jgi:hypothetical protein